MRANLKTPRSGALSPAALPWVVTFLTLAILGAAICLVSLHLRRQIRGQITSRDGEILYSVALAHQYESGSLNDLFGSIEEPALQLEVVLKTSRLKGVIAARLFGASGQFVDAFPPNVREAQLSVEDLRRLNALSPVSRYHARARLHEVYLRLPGSESLPDQALPLLEVNVPIHAKDQTRLLGVAQFIINGESIAQQFAALDRHLFYQAAAILSVGSLLIFLVVRHAFGRLQRANRLLSERTAELTRANQELVLSSKTSALGAVTAHLIHGLKNPLFGLRNLVNQCVQEPSPDFDTEWKTAAATTQQMHSIIDQAIRVLQDDQEIVASQISLLDLTEIIETKCSRLAREAGVDFTVDTEADGLIAHRTANLLILIFQNLIQNAIEATAKGKRVQLHLAPEGEEVVCEVRDEGSGIPEPLRQSLFAPCRSSKPNSSGIGLAISKQLANHLGATLILKESTTGGAVFSLRLPAGLFVRTSPAVAA